MVSKVAKGTIDCALNENSKRQTPSIVGFKGRERHVGDNAYHTIVRNYANSLANLKHIIGRKWDEEGTDDAPGLQSELVRFPNTFVESAANGASFKVSYNDKEVDLLPLQVVGCGCGGGGGGEAGPVYALHCRFFICLATHPLVLLETYQQSCYLLAFPPSQCHAMLLSRAETIGRGTLTAPLPTTSLSKLPEPKTDTVLSVPSTYGEVERRNMLASAEIANVRCLRLVNEHTAIALSYSVFKDAKGEFDGEGQSRKVMFCDVGESGACFSISAFTKGRLSVLAVAESPVVSGRLFDDNLVRHLAKAFLESSSMKNKTVQDEDVDNLLEKNPKTMLKLRANAEKLKVRLSPKGVTKADVVVECLQDDHDLQCSVTIEQYHDMQKTAVERIPQLVHKALEEVTMSTPRVPVLLQPFPSVLLYCPMSIDCFSIHNGDSGWETKNDKSKRTHTVGGKWFNLLYCTRHLVAIANPIHL